MPRAASPIQASDPLPVPYDLEEKADFIKRYVSHPRLTIAALPAFKKAQSASVAWDHAKERSLVSVKTSGGEWLMFS